mmetsp:Transcript_47/g.152  ORF Transcript_47/g.152 Transcript_47/m.152 type:complete len:293 (+) Transcript_47:87-965(+)|eukprot:CAMPEP_0115843260 /NCGR_PEP_ID=MMETSP0287-20121206/8221_1 /TAXON_ID=412157 /ORGANISM="Chrysochromulina rotalis, Strain UIO044" /LENGTH=292 /DNA_ID=CAMNT_0003296949 /DNA_START=57 /DNA_END=935 /DNA_ORIENTATION=-
MMPCIATTTQPNLLARAQKTGRPQLITIPYSNFCELGRWALKAGGSYDEIAKPPGAHVLPTLALRFRTGKHLSRSSRMMGGAPGGSPTGVPVCAMPDGSVLVDSWSLLRASAAKAGWCEDGLSDELVELLDGRLGPHARTLAYASLLKPANRNIWDELVTFEEGVVWRAAWACIGGQFGSVLKAQMNLADHEHIRNAIQDVDAGMQSLGEALAALPTDFWGGSRPGAADVAIAATLAPCVMPSGYCDGRFNPVWTRWLSQDDEHRAQIDAWRATSIGQHILRVYEMCGRNGP